MTDLEVKQGANGGWFIYQNESAILGSKDHDLIQRVRTFLENDGKCNHTHDEQIGQTKLWCCNICGNRVENF